MHTYKYLSANPNFIRIFILHLLHRITTSFNNRKLCTCNPPQELSDSDEIGKGIKPSAQNAFSDWIEKIRCLLIRENRHKRFHTRTSSTVTTTANVSVFVPNIVVKQ